MTESRLIIVTSITIFLLVTLTVVIFISFFYKKTKLIVQQKEKEIAFENELADTQVEIKEQTLNYIGQELHDDLGQKLSVVKLRLNQIANKIQTEQKEELLETNALLGECIQDIRNLTKTFVTEQIEHFGLIDSVEREVQRINKLNLIEVTFITNNHDVDLDNRHSLIIFRIIQETINNILKHSRAKKMQIEVMDSSVKLKIKICDNGKGFNVNEIQDGSGIKNIKSRAKLINAKYKITSEEDKGTTTTLNYYKK